MMRSGGVAAVLLLATAMIGGAGAAPERSTHPPPVQIPPPRPASPPQPPVDPWLANAVRYTPGNYMNRSATRRALARLERRLGQRCSTAYEVPARFRVGIDGRPFDVEVHTDANASACVIAVISETSFPTPPRPGSQDVVYTFTVTRPTPAARSRGNESQPGRRRRPVQADELE